MNRLLLGALVALGGITGCVGDAPNSRVSAQTEFDFTVAADRAMFLEQGLAFRGSVGPFAVYTVTAADPRLVGPSIEARQDVGYAMLCGATHYFVPEPASGELATMALHGGPLGGVDLVATDQQPAQSGQCSQPKDTFGNPLPDGGTQPPSMVDMGGPLEPPSFVPPGDSPDLSLTFVPPEGPVIQSLQVKFSPAPAVGSTVLVRRVALTGARQHNGSHVIPSICCTGTECTLGPIQ